MSEYDMYDSLVLQELKDTIEENKQLKDEKELWHKRALELRKFAPLDWYW